MEQLRTFAFSVCGAMLLTAMVQAFFPKNSAGAEKAVRMACGLFLLVSVLAAAAKLQLPSLSPAAAQNENSSFSQAVQSQTSEESRRALQSYLENMLQSAGIAYQDISLFMDSETRDSIELSRVEVRLVYAQDEQRTIALLSQLLTQEVQIEVETVAG